ncbi:Acinus [Carabus blaptoides fortunei]
MRRKSERNKSKSSVEKKPVEPSPRKSRRTSRRRKRSTSQSSSDDSDDVPLKTTVAVVEKQETVVCVPVDEPKKSTSHSASDEDKQEQPIWKVKTTEAPSGEIQKLKICLQRPPTTPERTEKSPRRRRGKASSQSDDASLTPDEKAPASGGGRRRLRRGSPAITTPGAARAVTADAIAKDECMIVVTETSLGKGKFECSQPQGQTEGSRAAGDESLKQCEIKQDDSTIATTRVDQQQEQTVQLQQKPEAGIIDKVLVPSVASAPEQSTKERVAVAQEQKERGKAASTSNVEEKSVDALQQSTDASSLVNTAEISKQQRKETASEQITVPAVKETAVKEISEEASRKIAETEITKTTSKQISEEITKTAAVQETSKEAVKNASVQETPDVCSNQSVSSLAASELTVKKRNEAAVKETGEEALTKTTETVLKETSKVCTQQSVLSQETNITASQKTNTTADQKISAVTSQQTSEPTGKETSREVVKNTSEAVVKETSEACSKQSTISLAARELATEETSAAVSQETSEAIQPVKEASATETKKAAVQQTKKAAVDETKEASQAIKEAVSQETSEAIQQINEAASTETKEAAVQQTNETAVEETKEAAVQQTKEASQPIKEAVSQETNEATQQIKEAASTETKEAAVQKTKEAAVEETKEAVVEATKASSRQDTKDAASQETKEAAVQETKAASRQETNEAVSQETNEASRQATNESSVPESSEAQDTNEAVSDQTMVTPSGTSEVSSQKTNDTVSSDVTSQDSEVVCTQSTEVTGETKVASPDTTESSNNEVTSSDASARVEPTVAAVGSSNKVQATADCTVVPRETSEAECTQADSNSEVVSEPPIPQTSEPKAANQKSSAEQTGSIKISGAQSQSVGTKSESALKDRTGSPTSEKINVVEGDSARQSSEKSTEKESSSSETMSAKPTNIIEDLSATVGTSVPTNRKRKWGKYEALLLADEHITMEKISKLYPNMKILSEDELRMDTEDVMREKPARKDRDVPAPVLPLPVKDEDVEKDVSNIGLNRKISIVNDEASKLQPPPSPPKNAVSAVLYITNLVRPFTLKQLKELLSRTGTILDDGFWTDRIKSKCYVQYENADEAEATRNALHGVQWPIGNGKKLMIDFGSPEAMEAARNATTEPPTTAVVAKPAAEKLIEKVPPTDIAKKEPQVEESRWEKSKAAPVREWDVGKVPQDQRDRSRSRDRPVSRNDRSDKRRHSRNESPPNGDHVTARKKKKDEPTEVKLMDDLFHKTKATPSIYWLPLTPEQIAKKQQQRLQRMAEHKRRMEESRRGERDFSRGGARARRRSARHDGV